MKHELINLILINNASYLEETYGNCDLSYLEKLSQSEECYYNNLKRELNKLLEVLTDIEKEIITERYSLNDEGMKTYDQIAQEYNTDIRIICNFELSALRKLSHPDRSKELTEYLDSDARINGSNQSVEVGKRSIC